MLVHFPAEVAAAAKSKDVCGWPRKQTSNQPAEFCVPRILHCPQATLAGSFHLPAFSKKKKKKNLFPSIETKQTWLASTFFRKRKYPVWYF